MILWFTGAASCHVICLIHCMVWNLKETIKHFHTCVITCVAPLKLRCVRGHAWVWTLPWLSCRLVVRQQLKITKSCQRHDYHSDFSFLSLGWERCAGMLSKALLIWPWFFSHTDAEIGCRLPKCTKGAVRGAGVPPDFLKGEYPVLRTT